MSYTITPNADCPVSRRQASAGVAYYAAIEAFLARPTAGPRARLFGLALRAGVLRPADVRRDVAYRARALGKSCPAI